MKEVHVECYPDGMLISKLGFTKKKIIHSFGKSRVLKKISRNKKVLSLVDEDPTAKKQPYEKQLRLVEEKNRMKLFEDSNGNRVIELKVELESWILAACSESRINPEDFNLSSDPEKLHREVKNKLNKFGDLIRDLIKKKNPSILQLKKWLQ